VPAASNQADVSVPSITTSVPNAGLKTLANDVSLRLDSNLHNENESSLSEPRLMTMEDLWENHAFLILKYAAALLVFCILGSGFRVAKII